MRNMHLSEGAIKKHRITIRILGPLKEVSKNSLFKFTAGEDESLLDVLKKLPIELRERIIKDGEVSPDLLILVDGVEASCIGRLDEVLVNGFRELVLVPVIHGG